MIRSDLVADAALRRYRRRHDILVLDLRRDTDAGRRVVDRFRDRQDNVIASDLRLIAVIVCDDHRLWRKAAVRDIPGRRAGFSDDLGVGAAHVG